MISTEGDYDNENFARDIPEGGDYGNCLFAEPQAVGGFDATPGSFPWMALLAYDPPNLKGIYDRLSLKI